MPFDAQWLDLREPADHAARDKTLLAHAARLAGPDGVIVDLACGTGSTLRAFDTVRTGRAQWRLVDHDAGLLTLAGARHGGTVTAHQMDLTDLGALPLSGATLVTASALLDLCSEVWVQALATRLAEYGLPFYAALSYDGLMSWDPTDPEDAHVTDAFNTHQRRDKGFGPALGPDAASTAAAFFTALGYEVRLAASPWVLDPNQSSLTQAFQQGVAQAADEAGATKASDWLGRRQKQIAQTTCTIGHLDLIALPPRT
jgi:hypothetical protein